MTNTRFHLLLLVCVLLVGCYPFFPSPQDIKVGARVHVQNWAEYKRTEAAHERERPCPELKVSGMEVEASKSPNATQKKFKLVYIGISPEIISASKLHWNKKCWAVSGIPPELLKMAIQNVLQSSRLLADDGQPGYILEARVLEQWEKSHTNGVEDFSKECHLKIQYTLLNPDTKTLEWEKQIITTAKVNYGTQAKGDKLPPEQITSNEYRRIIFESAIKQNLTILIEELNRF